MKKKSYLMLAALGLMASAAVFQSCDNDDNNDYSLAYPNAIVTVKPNADNSQFYLQLDDSTTLTPTNIKQSPFGNKEVRALVNYYRSDANAGHYSQAVYVNWIDSILTKNVLEGLGSSEENNKKYGADPLEIVNDWVTVAEDGYLTLRFRTRWGGREKHLLNLVHRSDVNKPYYYTLHQDAKGDTSGQVGDGLVAFKLIDAVDAEHPDKTDTLTLEWQSYSGKKTARFKFRVNGAKK